MGSCSFRYSFLFRVSHKVHCAANSESFPRIKSAVFLFLLGGQRGSSVVKGTVFKSLVCIEGTGSVTIRLYMDKTCSCENSNEEGKPFFG